MAITERRTMAVRRKIEVMSMVRHSGSSSQLGMARPTA